MEVADLHSIADHIAILVLDQEDQAKERSKVSYWVARNLLYKGWTPFSIGKS